MLKLHKVYASYGLMRVVFGVSLEVVPGESACLLGRNGMGKSTIFKTIVGRLPVESGTIKFGATDITTKQICERARLGIAYVPDDKGIFVNLTVLETLRLACMRKKSTSDIGQVIKLFPELSDHLHQHAGSLSGGEQQMLSISSALITEPKLLILDEVTEGLAPQVLERLSAALSELKRRGAMLLLAEQNVKFSCKIADRIFVIDSGTVVFSGTTEQFYHSGIIRDYILL